MGVVFYRFIWSCTFVSVSINKLVYEVPILVIELFSRQPINRHTHKCTAFYMREIKRGQLRNNSCTTHYYLRTVLNNPLGVSTCVLVVSIYVLLWY